jgi:hypothetical protein
MRKSLPFLVCASLSILHAAGAAASEAPPVAAPSDPAPDVSAPAAPVAVPAGRGAPAIVDSIAALQARIAAAVPGDTIVLKNGSYVTTSAIVVKCRGEIDRPIVIAAETVGGVEIGGTHGFSVAAPATHVTISGFRFTHAAGKTTIGGNTAFVRFSRNTFLCSGEGAFLSVTGDDAQVDYNDFGPKTASGTMISVSGVGSQVARRLWIHHNYFHDFENDGSGGAEMLRFGLLSSHGRSTSAAIVEHNLFARCRGVSDLVSNRCSGTTYRFNTFVESPTSHLTLLVGNDCIVAGNYFRQTEGLRFYGDRHQVFSNYFEANYIAVSIGNGDFDAAASSEAAPQSSRDRPDDCVVAFNTFVENRTHYQMSRRTPGGLGATNTIFANNVIQGGGPAAKIDGPYTGAVWQGNLLWKGAGARDLPADGCTQIDPLLAAGPDGILRPQAGSPAIEAAAGDFPAVTFDLDGQLRRDPKAKGADEFSAAPALAHFLSPSDVGPLAQEAPLVPPLP